MPALTVPPPFGPGSPSGGATGLTRRGIINQFSAGGLSPMALMTWSQMGYKPSHAGNILSMLQNSNCCPGAMTSMRPGADPNDLSSGARQVSCANGTVYKMENWQGGVRARRVVGSGPARCDTVGGSTGWGSAPRGRICPSHLAPVCGKDGRTYTNACEAADVGVKHAGACVRVQGGSDMTGALWAPSLPSNWLKAEIQTRPDPRPTLLQTIFSLRAVAWIGGAMFLAAAVRPLIPNAKYRQGGSFLLGVIGVSAIEKMFWPRK